MYTGSDTSTAGTNGKALDTLKLKASFPALSEKYVWARPATVEARRQRIRSGIRVICS